MHITLSSSPRVVVLAILAGAHGNIGDLNIVLTFACFYIGGPDVGYPPAASAEGSVSVIADFAFANDLSVTVSMCVLESSCSSCSPVFQLRRNAQQRIRPNVSCSCRRVRCIPQGAKAKEETQILYLLDRG